MDRADTLAAAVEADLVAHVSTLYEPFGQVHRDERAVWFVSGGTSPHENGVLRATLSRWHLGAEIDRLLEPFRERGLPMIWWVFHPPAARVAALDRVLRRRGATLASDLPGMAMSLDGFRAPAPPPGASVERVVDAAGLRVWGDIVGRAFDSPEFLRGLSFRGFATRGFGEDAPFRHYLCRLGEEPVGASTLSLGAGVAGLANIATVPEARRRGVGTASAAAALADARALGLRTAALSAEELGRPLYERLGFREVSRHRTYVWRPS